MPKRRVFVACPVADEIPGLMLGMWGQILLMLQLNGWEPNQSISNKMPLDKAREDLLRRALDSQNDYILWIDSDVFLDAKGAYRLLTYLETHPEVTAATGAYCKKVPPFGPTAFRWSDEKKDYVEVHPVGTAPEPVDAAGLGCVAIRLSDIRTNMRKDTTDPYFWFDGLGEDLNFFQQMRAAGLKMMLLPDVAPAHMGALVTPEVNRRLRRADELEQFFKKSGP